MSTIPSSPSNNYYCYYPFLKGALAKHGHITSFNEQSVYYAFENIEKYNPTKLLELDLTSWLISTIMLHNLNNNYLTRKFVANYGKFIFESRCLKGGKDFLKKEIRMEILDYFGIEKDILFDSVQKIPYIKIHVMDYLELLEQGLSVSAPQFQLVNQTLNKGFVFIEVPRFIYVLRLALEQRLITKITKNMKDFKDNELINECVDRLREKYPRFDKQSAPSQQNIPYSIQELIDKAFRENNLSHRERIRLGIYLQSNGFEEDYILNIFKALSDYSERTTRYQLQSLRKYINK